MLPTTSVYKNSVIPLFRAQSWSINSSGPTGIINLSSPTLRAWYLVSCVLVSVAFLEAPARFQPWAARLLARPGRSGEAPRSTRRWATCQFSMFSFGRVFWLSRWPSPDRTHWRDGPTHQEWPQDKVRPRGQPPGRSLPQWVERRQITSLGSQEGSLR